MAIDSGRHVKGIISSLLKRWEGQDLKKGTAVRDAWQCSVEEDAKGHSYPVSLKGGVLMVIVDNPPWLYKLTLDKRKIIAAFNKSYQGRKKIKGIRFRVGTWD